MNPLLFTIIIIGWIFASSYSIVIGIQMMINPQYRHYFANLWFRSRNKQDRQHHALSVGFMGGPLYILIGASFFLYGIWILDLSYHVLDNFMLLRAVVNLVAQ